MKVAIFGSFPEPGSDNGKGWELTGYSEDFKAACRQIGHGLAKRRCTLVVESENSKVADPHVVAGYIDAAETLASNTTASLRLFTWTTPTLHGRLQRSSRLGHVSSAHPSWTSRSSTVEKLAPGLTKARRRCSNNWRRARYVSSWVCGNRGWEEPCTHS